MATLNNKNFPGAVHHKLKERARRQHRSVAQEATHILDQALRESEPLSILELEGLESGVVGGDRRGGARRA